MNISTNPDIQIQKGREAMVYFHNDSVVYPNYNLTLDALIHQVSKGKDSIFLEGFGFAIEQLNTDGFFSGNVVKNAMEKFARRAQGRVPDNMSAFFNALSNEATQVNWVDATGYVAKDVAVQVGDGLVQVGETVTTTLKGLGMVLPFLVVGALIFIVAEKSKKLAA